MAPAVGIGVGTARTRRARAVEAICASTSAGTAEAHVTSHCKADCSSTSLGSALMSYEADAASTSLGSADQPKVTSHAEATCTSTSAGTAEQPSVKCGNEADCSSTSLGTVESPTIRSYTPADDSWDAWWDADLDVVTAAAAKVVAWGDQSGNGNYAQQPTGVYQGTLDAYPAPDSRVAIKTDGTHQGLVIITTGTMGTGRTFSVVCGCYPRAIPMANDYASAVFQAFDALNNACCLSCTGATHKVGFFQSGCEASNLVPTVGAQVMSWLANGTSGVTCYRNGTVASSVLSQTAGSPPILQWLISNQGGSYGHDGWIRRVCYSKTIVAADVRARAEVWCAL